MKTVSSLLSPRLCSYPLSLIGHLEDILFIDIETTGFTARSSCLYLIGAIYFEKDQIHLMQFFAEKKEEEVDVLKAFLSLCQSHSILVHYNGNNFDIPYMKQKCAQYHLREPFSHMTGVDIYKRIMPYKKLLGLENVKQKTVEQFMGIKRDDQYNGGELIQIYEDYVKAPLPSDLDLLLLHNADDMKGMFSILPVLTYSDMFTHPFKVVKVQSNKYEDMNGDTQTEVLMKIRFPFLFPKQITFTGNGCRFRAEENEGYLKVPVVYGSMKYFYSNYKEYYYLPAEDTAMHKSVAAFVDPQFREPAKASTCYTRKEGAFLPQWDIIFSPVFKAEYGDKLCYFELTEAIKRSPAEFGKYAYHILDMLVHGFAK